MYSEIPTQSKPKHKQLKVTKFTTEDLYIVQREPRTKAWVDQSEAKAAPLMSVAV